MAHKPLDKVLQHVRMLAAVHAYRDLSDRELLDRFVGMSDEASFTVLIDRHGPMLLGVCRRALGNVHDAEDGCQATFLVLARKAASIRKNTSLSSWLHGVACRVAAGIKRDRARRQRRERKTELPPSRDTAREVSWREMQTILDQELEQLPQRYKAPLILCYLDGKTRDQAARQLGLSPGSLHGRLERGRDLLRQRLTRRGLTLGAALFATALGESTAQAALPATFVISWTKAALALAGGQTLTDGIISASVLTLTREALKGMFLTKLKLGIAAVVCACAVAAITGGSLTAIGEAQDLSSPSKAVIAGAQKAESDEDFIRRVSRELRGSDPTPAEIHFFVANNDAGRRQKLIDLFIQERQARKTGEKTEAADAAKRQQAQRLENITKALAAEGEKIKEKRRQLINEVQIAGSGDPIALSVKQKSLLEEYGVLNRVLIELDTSIQTLKALQTVQKGTKDYDELEATLIEQYLHKHPKLEIEQHEITKVEMKIKDLSKRVNEDSPLLVKLRDELEVAKKQLAKVKADLQSEAKKKAEELLEHRWQKDVKSTETKLKVMQEQREALKAKVKSLYDKADQIGKSAFAIELLRNELTETQDMARSLRKEQEHLNLELFNNSNFAPEIATPVRLATIQQDFIRELLGAKEKADTPKTTRAYLDRLLQYVKDNPKSEDVPEAMLQIMTVYESQGNTVEAGAWRGKLLKEHPDSAAARAAK